MLKPCDDRYTIFCSLSGVASRKTSGVRGGLGTGKSLNAGGRGEGKVEIQRDSTGSVNAMEIGWLLRPEA